MKADYPLLLTPAYKDYIWGGNQIEQILGRNTGLRRCAEAWEVSTRPEGLSTIENGPLGGSTLAHVMDGAFSDIMGAGMPAGPFPLLVKIIDARERLSLQVHPDNTSATTVNGEPKTELWYMLKAAPGAELLAALNADFTTAQIHAAISNGALEQLLHRLPAAPGQALFVPGGRLHAIGAGCLLLEVQQNSNTTYRVYDWGRTGDDGRPRELHIEKALQVINLQDRHPQLISPALIDDNPPVKRFSIIDCEFFNIERIEVSAAWNIPQRTDAVEVIFAEQGAFDVKTGNFVTRLPFGRTCLLPAAIRSVELIPLQPQSALIRIRLPPHL